MRPPLEHDRRIPAAPIVVVGRSRSGTRVLAELLRRSGVYMGAEVDPRFLDSISWYQRFVVPLLSAAGSPPPADRQRPAEWESYMEDRLQDTMGHHLPDGPVFPWGWKYPETLFLMPIVKRRLAEARFIHVIRDGRDVTLSNGGHFHLTYFTVGNPSGWRPPDIPGVLRPGCLGDSNRWTPSFRQFCLSVTFGDPLIREWRGLDLADPRQLAENKFLIQMQSWRHSVETARMLAPALDGAYREIRYERLCLNPLAESASLFEWLGMDLSVDAKAYLENEIGAGRVRRWPAFRFTPAERRDFENACEHGHALLKDLDHDSARP